MQLLILTNDYFWVSFIYLLSKGPFVSQHYYVPKYNVTQNICKVFLIAFGYINFGDLLTLVQIYAFIGIYAAVIIISISMCGNKDFVDYTLRVINAVIVVWEASLYFSMHSTLQNNVFA